MSFNIISILLLFLLILSKRLSNHKSLSLNTHPDYSLWVVILILIIRIILQLLYSGSSWYFKPLIEGHYLIVYLWYEGPIFAVISIWPFYQIILKELRNKGVKKYTQGTFSEMKEKSLIAFRGVFWCLILLISYAILVYITEAIFFDQKEILTPKAEDSFRESLIRFTESSLLQILFFIDDVLLFPIAEELFFRGYCYTALKKQIGTKWGIIVSSMIFSFYHQDIAAIIPYFLIGIILANVYERSRSLIPPFFIHSFYNVIMFLVYQ